MKNLIFVSVLVLFSLMGVAQSDTLFTSTNKKIPCKIYEINEFEIKYRLAQALDGPIYVIDKSTISKYTLSNGFTERFIRDEMSLENEHKEILGNRQVIKINPFGFAFDHVTLSYEQVIKVGMNLDIELGYINSGLTNSSAYGTNGFQNYNGNPPYTVGAYIKPGVKFFLGQDFSVKGLKYAHPLKGRYIKLDIAISYLNFQNVQSYIAVPAIYPSPYTYSTVSTDLNSVAYGGFINYGRQFILGNILTLDYYFGIGFTGQSSSYSNPNYLSTLNQNYGYYGDDQAKRVSNYYGFLRVPSLGLSFTTGLRLGFIIPNKKSNRKANVVTNKID